MLLLFVMYIYIYVYIQAQLLLRDAKSHTYNIYIYLLPKGSYLPRAARSAARPEDSSWQRPGGTGTGPEAVASGSPAAVFFSDTPSTV